jgi:hypothetical protein
VSVSVSVSASAMSPSACVCIYLCSSAPHVALCRSISSRVACLFLALSRAAQPVAPSLIATPPA